MSHMLVSPLQGDGGDAPQALALSRRRILAAKVCHLHCDRACVLGYLAGAPYSLLALQVSRLQPIAADLPLRAERRLHCW